MFTFGQKMYHLAQNDRDSGTFLNVVHIIPSLHTVTGVTGRDIFACHAYRPANTRVSGKRDNGVTFRGAKKTKA